MLGKEYPHLITREIGSGLDIGSYGLFISAGAIFFNAKV